jgi:hypothetical protein
MKSVVIYLCLFAFGGLGAAQTACSREGALPFSFPSDAAELVNGGVTSNLDEALAGQEALNNAREKGSELLSSAIKARGLRLRPSLNKRADFFCTGDETCYTINNGLFCANGNGNYHEPDGTTGNLNTGDYVLADGQVGNFFTGPDPVLTGTVTPRATTASVPTQTAATNDITESGLSNAASATSNAPARTSSAGSQGTRLSPSESVASFPREGASSALEYPSIASTAVISLIAGTFLWRVFFS